MAKGKTTKEEQTEGEAARESATGVTPKVETLPVGMKLFRTYKGKRYDFEIVEVEGKRLIKMTGKKGTWASLSSAAQAVSGHAERGATVMRDAKTGETLIPISRYEAMAATPGPRRPKAKAGAKQATRKAAPKKARIRKGDGRNGTVKVTKGVRCGHCRAMIPASEAAAHALTHPAK